MAHFKSAAITATYFEVKYSTCVCSPVRITLWINAVDLFTHFQHCSFHLSLGMTSDFFKLLTLSFFQVQCEELKETIQENFT